MLLIFSVGWWWGRRGPHGTGVEATGQPADGKEGRQEVVTRLVVCVEEPFPKRGPRAPKWPAGALSGLHVTHPLEQSCFCCFQHSRLEPDGGGRGSWETGVIL